jgi:hypothetical protein
VQIVIISDSRYIQCKGLGEAFLEVCKVVIILNPLAQLYSNCAREERKSSIKLHCPAIMQKVCL